VLAIASSIAKPLVDSIMATASSEDIAKIDKEIEERGTGIKIVEKEDQSSIYIQKVIQTGDPKIV
jgi:hypothetical protein